MLRDAALSLATVIFDIDDTTTALVARLRLDGSKQYLVTRAKPHGELKDQEVGLKLDLVVEADGNPDDFVLINIKNAVSDTIKMKVSDSPGTKTIIVTG